MTRVIKKILNFLAHPKENYSNFYYFKYHLQKTLGKIKTNSSSPKGDMFNWSFYNTYYRGELKEAQKNYSINLKKNDYNFINSKLVKVNEKIKPLHPNHKLLYETILQLEPESILEVGCGNGMHLANIQILFPKIKLYGVDRSEEQIKFLHESFPDLKANVGVADATIPFPDNLPRVKLSFTQAVIMHIHTGDSHLTALSNLFNMSNKYVALMESWKNHQFMDDIKKLHEQKKIKWPNLYFYYKLIEEGNSPHLMICSSEKLNFPVLDDYNLMLRSKKH